MWVTPEAPTLKQYICDVNQQNAKIEILKKEELTLSPRYYYDGVHDDPSVQLQHR
jgi:hypothetical protein